MERPQGISYEELTRATEHQLLALAARASGMTGAPGREMLRQWAFGIFICWSNATTEMHSSEDFEYIYQLATRVGGC